VVVGAVVVVGVVVVVVVVVVGTVGPGPALTTKLTVEPAGTARGFFVR
jgi:hypothetical protein